MAPCRTMHTPEHRIPALAVSAVLPAIIDCADSACKYDLAEFAPVGRLAVLDRALERCRGSKVPKMIDSCAFSSPANFPPCIAQNPTLSYHYSKLPLGKLPTRVESRPPIRSPHFIATGLRIA